MRPFEDVISLEAARAILDRTGGPIENVETILLSEANGRVLAASVIAQSDVPPFSRAGMDGYAVRARDTQGASRQAPRTLTKVGTLYTGQVSPIQVGDGECLEISTGAPMPRGADAVVMVEEPLFFGAVADWFAGDYAPDAEAGSTGWPAFRASVHTRETALRYGENPHQRAALYTEAGSAGGGLAGAEQLHGKAMSYNNYVDADAALRAAYDFDEPCVAIIKHANPCGIAVGADNAEAHRKAHASDPVSAFGGVIATNREVGAELAAQVAEIFTEVVVAPGFTAEAVETLSKKKNIRLLAVTDPARGPRVETRQISGGLLVQDTDVVDAEGQNLP